MPSLVKKYLMALTGLVLVGFVVGHLVGNLQMFGAPEEINRYAHFLHHGLPGLPVHWDLLVWGVRGFLALCVLVHIYVGATLAKENRAARPEQYAIKTSRNASPASKFGFLGNLYMPVSGIFILAFIPFHILHFTVRACFTGIDAKAYENAATLSDGTRTFDVHGMVVDGFSNPYVSAFYIAGMILLFAHLAHGVSSMFQSVGFRNEKWRPRLDKLAKAAAILVAAGFISIPAAVLAGAITKDGFKCPMAKCHGDTCCAPAAK